MLNSLSGLFTSLGLLGTFVAICNSLGDINQDTLEIDTIIRNFVPAFTSSIAGLISAFIEQQDVRYGIHMKTGNWKRKLTYKHLKSVCITLPCCQLQQMNLYKVIDKLLKNIKDFGEDQFKKCADALETLTDKMSSLSTGLLEEQKTNVQQMIAGTNTELQSVSNNVTEQIT